MSKIGAAIAQVLAIQPEAPAVEFEHVWASWQDLKVAADNLARTLAEQGQGPGTRVAVLLRNRVEMVPVLIALLGADYCLATINAISPDDKLAQEIKKVDAPVTIALASDWERAGVIEAARAAGTIGLSLSDGEVTVLSQLVGESNRARKRADGIAIEMLSSGTTGEPKRIPLKATSLHKALLAAASFEKGRGEDDAPRLRSGVQIVSAPLAHIAGITAVMNNLLAGRKICLLEKFTVAGFRDAMVRHRPKVANAPPAALRMLLDANIPAEDFASLVAFRTGTAPLDPELADAFYERYSIPVLQNYGATEFAGGIAGWTLADHQQFWAQKRGSVGRLNAGVAGRIVDVEDARELAAGQQGLLEVRGANVADGREWVRTTDLAIIDAEGFLWIKGRADGAIIRGGFKILPEDILRALQSHPAVLEAAVIGLKDQRLGQVPVAAWIARAGVAAPDEAGLKEYLKQQLLPYQVPVRILRVDELPRTSSLKVNQPALRAMFEALTPASTA